MTLPDWRSTSSRCSCAGMVPSTRTTISRAVLYDELEEIPTRMATRKAVERARRVLERAGWPVTIRTEYGIGYSVSWPHKWTMPA